MVNRIELSSDFFGNELLYGTICTYNGSLEPWDFDSSILEDDDDDTEYEFDSDSYFIEVEDRLREFFEGYVFETIFKPLGFSKLIYEKLDRPMYYNYTGDRVLFSLEYDTDVFSADFENWAYCKIDDLDEDTLFVGILESRFSSYPGFSSCTPNNTNDLKRELLDSEYQAINAFLAAWVATEIFNGAIDGIDKDDFYSKVVEPLNGGIEFWKKVEK
jgi:hypothetical protein